MRLVICSRENLSEPLETLNCPVYHSTIAQLLADKCPAFKLEYNRYISAYADGEKVPLDRWETFRLDGISELMFVLEPGAGLGKQLPLPPLSRLWWLWHQWPFRSS
jgi:hypothetical protein